MSNARARAAEGRPTEAATPQAGLGWPEVFQRLGEGTMSPGRRARPDARAATKARRATTDGA